MHLDISGIRYLTARLLGRAVDGPHEFAHRTWKHAPAGVLRQSPPCFLPDELDRVIGISRFSSFEIERERLFAPEFAYPSTEIFEFTGAALRRGMLYSGPGRWALRKAARTVRKMPRPRRLPVEPTGFLIDTSSTRPGFDQWLLDQLATEWMGSNLGYPVFSSARRFQHGDAYRALMPWHAQPLADAWFERVLVARDVGQNPSRVARQRVIRKTLRDAWHTASGPQLVYLAADSQAASNPLKNEQEIRQYITQRGGLVVETESSSVRELAQALGHARLVVGVEGGAFAHAVMLAPERTTLLLIQPPRAFHNVFKTYTDAVEMRYAFTVADDDPEGFRLPADRLARAMDLVEETGRAPAADAQRHVRRRRTERRKAG